MERFNSERISAEDVGILDKNAEWLGIPLAHLMECAGYSAALEIISKYNLETNSKVLIFCGSGNNGGDGFVIARHLAAFKINPIVILLSPPEKIRTHEANINWNIIKRYLTYSIQSKIITDSSDLHKFFEVIVSEGDIKLIIDCMLGTGIKGKIREPIATAIDEINRLKEEKGIKVVAIDVPSGLDPNTGKVFDKAIKSDFLISFHRIKKGLKTDGDYIKEITVKSIGIPPEAEIFIGRGDFLSTMKARPLDCHKGQYGKLLIIGGSKDYSGAPAYASLAAIAFGIDLVITYVPEVIGATLRNYSPNLIVRTGKGDYLGADAYEELHELIKWCDSVIIGPGIGLKESTENLLKMVVKNIVELKKTYVLDADALKLIKNHLDLIKNSKCILTPHEGELKILCGESMPNYNDIEKRFLKVKEIAKNFGCVLLLKGPYDYISNGEIVKINKTGCPEMSKGGTGDVLAGLCGSFLALGNSPFRSACSAAFLNGYTGEYCKKYRSERFTPMDMINNLDLSIKELIEWRLN